MALDDIPYLRLRKRGAWADPQRDLLQWETDVGACTGSLARAAASRWSWSPSGQWTTARQLAPGRIDRIVPTAMLTQVPLPTWGPEMAGRMTGVQHYGTTRTAIQLTDGQNVIAGATSPGEIGTALWDGYGWIGVDGAAQWVDIQPFPVTAAETVDGVTTTASGSWGNWRIFPDSASYQAVRYRLPRSWLGSDVYPIVELIHGAAGAGTVNLSSEWEWIGVGGAPLLADPWAAAAPSRSSATLTPLAMPAALQVYRVADFPVATAISSLLTQDAQLLIRYRRLAGDSYVGAVILWDCPLRVQVRSAGSRSLT